MKFLSCRSRAADNESGERIYVEGKSSKGQEHAVKEKDLWPISDPLSPRHDEELFVGGSERSWRNARPRCNKIKNICQLLKLQDFEN